MIACRHDIAWRITAACPCCMQAFSLKLPCPCTARLFSMLYVRTVLLIQDEKELFERSAQHAYESFRNKAAESRGMSVEDMQQVAQVRHETSYVSISHVSVAAFLVYSCRAHWSREDTGPRKAEHVLV